MSHFLERISFGERNVLTKREVVVNHNKWGKTIKRCQTNAHRLNALPLLKVIKKKLNESHLNKEQLRLNK